MEPASGKTLMATAISATPCQGVATSAEPNAGCAASAASQVKRETTTGYRAFGRTRNVSGGTVDAHTGAPLPTVRSMLAGNVDALARLWVSGQITLAEALDLAVRT